MLPDPVFLVAVGTPIMLAMAMAMVRWPRPFFVVYVIVSTKAFGLLPMDVSMLIPSALLLIHLSMVGVVLAKLAMGHQIPGRSLKFFLAAVMGLWCFGIVHPIVAGDSGLFFALVESKNFLCYAGLGFLLVHREHFDIEFFERLFTAVGVILVAILILGRVSGMVPPGYFYHPEKDFIHVDHIFYFTLALYFAFSHWISTWDHRHAALAAFLFVGLVIQGHRSVLIITLIQLPALLALRGRWPVELKLMAAVIPLVLAGSITSGALGYSNPIYEKGLAVLQTTEDDLLAGRENANLLRYALIAERPLLGYGFINKNSSLGSFVALQSSSRFNETMGVIDSGYIDLAIRFGLFGTIVFMAALVFLLARHGLNWQSLEPSQAAVLLLLTGCLAIHFTWAVLSYEHGVIAINVMIFILTSDFKRGSSQGLGCS